jgi:hypothetical protein
MTNEEMYTLVKECGLDWKRGCIPLFEGDTTNRFAVLIEAVIAGCKPLSDEQERRAFEAFATNCPMGQYDVSRRGNSYWSSHTEIMWDTWKERATHCITGQTK